MTPKLNGLQIRVRNVAPTGLPRRFSTDEIDDTGQTKWSAELF